MYKINGKQEIVDRYFPLKYYLMGSKLRFVKFEDLYNIDPIFGNDTVYSVSDAGVKARYFVYFGGRALTINIPQDLYSLSDFKSIYQDKFSTLLGNFIETSNWCCLKFAYHRYYYYAYYSKKSHKTYVSKVYPPVPNRTTPYYMVAASENRLISVIDPHKIIKDHKAFDLDKIKNNAIEKEIQLRIRGLSATDNPVLLICILKDN